MDDSKFKIVAFYEFQHIDSPQQMRGSLKSFCAKVKIRGTIIVASEGINGTICGLNEDVDSFLQFTSAKGFANNNIKISNSDTMPFYRLKVKVKTEDEYGSVKNAPPPPKPGSRNLNAVSESGQQDHDVEKTKVLGGHDFPNAPGNI